jgi:predicted DsbA family dithiol-disulfide isomerase
MVHDDRASGEAMKPLAWACLAALFVACASPFGGETPTADPGESASSRRVVARIGDREITLDELDQRIKDDLFQESFGRGSASRLHDARTETIEQMIDELLLDRASEDAGLTPDQWRAQLTAEAEPVSDDEVAAFYEANRARLSAGDTLESLSPNIRRYLELRAQQEALAALRPKYRVWVGLDRPRQAVGADGPAIGPVDAKITLVEFSDYQCPYCARAEPVVQELLRRYPNDIRLVYRHLPLPFHADARGAAEAAICAWDQGKFWDYHELLFTDQRALGAEQLLEYADRLALDREAFAACLGADITAQRVRDDMVEAESLGATGTPTFFINGMMMTGARPIEEFEAVIDAELARLGG